MINLSNFEENLKAGLVVLAKVGDSYAISSQKFDPDTGKKIASVVEALDIVDLENKAAELLKASKQIESLVASLKLLK